jgi:16S rRNA (guanine1516-N2)-methyltransferase
VSDARIRLYYNDDVDIDITCYAPWFDVMPASESSAEKAFYLRLSRGGLTLHRGDDRRGIGVTPSEIKRRAVRGSTLARAVGVRSTPVVLDVMAGLGRDGLALAHMGCRVTLVERVPALWALLKNLTARLGSDCDVRLDDGWKVVGRASADVIYLDPMYPVRGKRALPGKELQYLRALAAPSGHGVAEWVEHARRHARQRVVLKRRAADAVVTEPDWQIRGRQVRYDIYRAGGGAFNGA